MKHLKPLILKPKYYEEIEREIMRFFDELIYKPIFEAAEIDKEFKNTKDSLVEAILAGTVEWDGGEKFTGTFNSAISKQLLRLGAKYNSSHKAFYLQKANIPVSVSLAKASADSNFLRLRKSVLKTLDDSTIDSIFAFHFKASYLQEKYDKAIEWMEGDFQKTVKDVTIAPELTPDQRKNIAEKWTNNLELYIRNWTQENVVALREKIELNAYAGQRAENMVKLIQGNYGVSRNKAKFLARQETSLLMSKFKEERYKDVGIEKYKWSSSADEKVRDDHKHLHGKTFFFSSPPIADRKTGQRGNPGEPYNCRCIALPVWD